MSIYDSHRVYLIILPFVHCKENYGRSVNNNQIIRRQQKYSFICNCKVLLLSIIHIQDKPLCTLTGRENSLEVKQVFIGRECRLSYLRAIKAIPRSQEMTHPIIRGACSFLGMFMIHGIFRKRTMADVDRQIKKLIRRKI